MSEIEVSSSLITDRDLLRDSSWLVPSGAYLTWMEMLKEENNSPKPQDK